MAKKIKLSEAIQELSAIAKDHNLKLNKGSDFVKAKSIYESKKVCSG